MPAPTLTISIVNGKYTIESLTSSVNSGFTALYNEATAKAALTHTHAISEVTGLQAALDAKQASGSYAAATHTHTIAQITSLQTSLDNLQSAIDGKAATTHTHTIANVTGLQTALDAKAPLTTGIGYISTTAYTLVLADAGKVILRNNAAANTVTIPANSAVAFPVGTTIGIIQNGAGVTTINSSTGVTINGLTSNPVAAAARWQGLTLIKVASDEWVVSGGAV